MKWRAISQSLVCMRCLTRTKPTANRFKPVVREQARDDCALASKLAKAPASLMYRSEPVAREQARGDCALASKLAKAPASLMFVFLFFNALAQVK